VCEAETFTLNDAQDYIWLDKTLRSICGNVLRQLTIILYRPLCGRLSLLECKCVCVTLKTLHVLKMMRKIMPFVRVDKKLFYICKIIRSLHM
jgi:hypothetical protein